MRKQLAKKPESLQAYMFIIEEQEAHTISLRDIAGFNLTGKKNFQTQYRNIVQWRVVRTQHFGNSELLGKTPKKQLTIPT